MPDANGMEVLKQIHSELPKLPVLILSMHAEDQYAVRVLRAGASGYLSKEAAPDKLLDAIRKITRGAKYVSPEVSDQLVFNIGKNPSQLPHELLSQREYQV